MPGRFFGQRGARESEWSWERAEDTSEGRNGRRLLRAAVVSTALLAGIAALAFGVFLIASNDDGTAAPPTVSASPTPDETPTGTPPITATPRPTPTMTPAPTTPTPTLAPTASPSPAPTPSYAVSFTSWSRAQNAWIGPAHNGSSSDYTEGEMVPFLLRLDNARPGETYDIQITYDCTSAGVPAFDYLGGLDPAETAPIQTSPGPGALVPDSTLMVPDDPSIDFDGPQQGAFRAWGGVFSAASGPNPTAACTGTKTINLSLLAQESTLALVWTGHLASPDDWGASNGASGATPFTMAVEVNGEVQQAITMTPGSVLP